MRFLSLAPLLNFAFKYVSKTCNTLIIDESHGLKHSMEVFHLSNKIYESEVEKRPQLQYHRDIIYTSAILHDMCDKKYINEKIGLTMINNGLREYLPEPKINVVNKIISTMSYSKVKVNGFPDLNEYQLAYHIVREADLLTAYDIDRTIIYGMKVENLEYTNAITRAINLFETRILKYRSDKLFVTEYSKKESLKLHKKAIKEINILKGVK